MRVYPFVLAVTVAAGCHPTPPPAALTPADPSAMPATLRGFHLTATEPIDEKDGGGKLFRYRDTTAGYMTVFVYPIPDDIRESPDTDRWVLNEGSKFAQVIPILVQRGRFDSYQMAFQNAEPVVTKSDTIPGFAAAAVTRSGNTVEVQLEYLYIVHDQFLKIRATLPEDDWKRTPVPLFAHDLATVLAARP